MIRVVLLEPCPVTRRALVRVLAGEGVHIIASGALEVFGELDHDAVVQVILADVDALRGMAYAQVSRFRLRWPDVRVILMSAGNSDDQTTLPCAARCRYADGLLVKPFENERLFQEINRARATTPRSRPLCPAVPSCPFFMKGVGFSASHPRVPDRWATSNWVSTMATVY